MKRILAMAFACVLMMVFPAISMAENKGDTGISPRYSYTRRVGAGLHISSSGNAQCEGYAMVYDESSTISLKVSLYQKVGNSWDRITSWYDSSTGTDTLDIVAYYQLSEYGTYKVLVTGTVTAAGGGSEWISLESSHVTYP